MNLIVVGAGYTGARVATLAAEAGAEVVATTSNADRREQLESAGVVVRAWSWADGMDALGTGEDTVIVYSIPPVDAAQPADIVELARRSRRFVYLSSTGVYGDHAEGEINEDSERNPVSQAGVERKAIEDALFESGLDALMIRIVGIYGPGRTIDRYLANGRYKVVDGGQKLTNRIHVDDLADVVLAAAERAPRGPRAYIAADGAPVRVRDLVDWVVEHKDIDPPEEVTLEAYRAERGDAAAERWTSSYTASNARMLDELGVELRYPTVFDGYREILLGGD